LRTVALDDEMGANSAQHSGPLIRPTRKASPAPVGSTTFSVGIDGMRCAGLSRTSPKIPLSATDLM
jgi:hypothetical protein